MGEVLIHQMNLIVEKIAHPDADLCINYDHALGVKSDRHMSRWMTGWIDCGALGAQFLYRFFYLARLVITPSMDEDVPTSTD
jgi:hypothetical protein